MGSTHNATAWEGTSVAQEHESILEPDEWIWADFAYPVSAHHSYSHKQLNYVYLETWIVSPYKKPEQDEPCNKEFNNAVSMVCIQLEHAIGFLKGQFHLLKHLQVDIKDAASHKFATYWIAACIGIHAFAMQCRVEKHGEDTDDEFEDPFVREGLSSSDLDLNHQPLPTQQNASQWQVHAAKAKHKKLKRKLFRHKEQVQVGHDVAEADDSSLDEHI